MTGPRVDELASALSAAFAADLAARPMTTLRSGDARDSYCKDIPFDADIDVPTDEYLERFSFGVSHLDAASWRHYLPVLGTYALKCRNQGSNVIDALIQSLRPPDRDPPRLASLSPAQEDAIRQLLEVLAFAGDSAFQSDACQALEEWWVENPLYRPAK